MGRNPRFDEADSWHHVMNRGIARRTMFETEDDIRFFLSRIARTVRRGQLELHAFCVMTTHFHLLVRSPRGQLSRALQSIQNEYVPRFNRARRRDGSLVRGRFLSKPVRSVGYRRTLVRYIDANPVMAGLVPVASLYPHGSARHYARPDGPPWLARDWVESSFQDSDGPNDPSSGLPGVRTGPPLTPALQRLVERRIAASPREEDPLDELLAGAAPDVRDWMRRKAILADGTRPGIPVVDPESVERAIARRSEESGTWTVKLARRSADGWIVAKIALLRELCGTTLEEAAARSDRTIQGACNLHRQHRRLMLVDETYATRLGALAKEALSDCHAAPKQRCHGSRATACQQGVPLALQPARHPAGDASR